jgi:DNA-binding MarR family transcriptional regulator
MEDEAVLDSQTQQTDLCALDFPPDDAVSCFKQLLVTFLKLQRQLETVLEPHGLVLSQFEALAKIGIKPGMIQQELVKHLLVTKGNVGALLDRLESLGWVQRCACPNDRRANKLYLTDGGREKIREIIKQHRIFLAETFKPLSADQRAQLQSLLKIIEPA